MVDRNYILDRMKSKSMTIEEFNFDKLSAPPIMALFTAQDIYELHAIATSLRYSAKPQLKRQMIDEIMRRRGFVFHIGGTNRLTYTFIHDDSFIAKVAFDAVGINDNPAEYKNQFIFKPFVTKVFEVTPCGTLGFFERVKPITNREEFISVADDVFILINSIFIGEYVLADIGSRFFMNYGIRDGFGVVLLDYPYCYPLDGNKLYCTAQDPTSPSGCCDGIIDYDDGFNFLVCTKCGARYKAAELTSEVTNHKVKLVKRKGDIAMVIRVTGGSQNANTTVKSGDHYNEAKSLPPTNSVPMKVVTIKAGETSHKPTKKIVSTIDAPSEKPKMQVKITPSTNIEKKVVADAVATEIKAEVEDKPKVEEKKPVVQEQIFKVNGVGEAPVVEKKVEEKPVEKPVEKKQVVSAINIHDKEEDVAGKVNKMLEELAALIPVLDPDQKPAVVKKLVDLADQNGDLNNPSHHIAIPNNQYEACKKLIKMFDETFDHVEEPEQYESILKDSNLVGFIDRYYEVRSDIQEIFTDEDNMTIKIRCNLMGNSEELIPVMDSAWFSDDQIVLTMDQVGEALGITQADVDATNTEKAAEAKTEEPQQVEEEDLENGDFKFFKAEVVNTKELRPELKNGKKVLVMRSTNGDLITMGADRDIIAIDHIDGKSTDSLAIVSRTWLDGVSKQLDSLEAKEMPAGVLQQDASATE